MVALVHVCNLLSTLALRSHSPLDTRKVHAILSSTDMFGNSSLHIGLSFMAAAHVAGRGRGVPGHPLATGLSPNFE